MSSTTPFQALDRATLTPVVRRALRRDGAEVESWRVEPRSVPGTAFNPTNGGIYRLTGIAWADGATVPWSLIAKILRSPAGAVTPNGEVIPPELAEDPAGFNYWRREALAYATGLAGGLPGGLAAPRFLGVTERPGPSAWLWLEEVAGDTDAPWPIGRYGLAARHLGTFNGTSHAGGTLPDAPWLSRGWLRNWVAIVLPQAIAHIERHDAWAHPTLRRAFPAPFPERFGRLWAGREAFLAALDRLPRALCHLDACRANLLARCRADGREETVALDWAFVGPAAIGEEVGALVAASLLHGAVSPGDAAALDEAAFAGYLAGLREAGWVGDERAVRLGYTASVALRYALMTLFDPLRAVGDDGHAAALEREEGAPLDAILARRAALAAFLLDRADEAHALLGIAAERVPPKVHVGVGRARATDPLAGGTAGRIPGERASYRPRVD